MLKGKKCPRAGLRVKADPNAVSMAMYSPGHGPTPGATGTVEPVSTGRGKKTCIPGPGGGLIYVKWDDGRTFGVSRYDIAKAKGKAVVMQAAPAVYGLGAKGVPDSVSAGRYYWVWLPGPYGESPVPVSDREEAIETAKRSYAKVEYHGAVVADFRRKPEAKPEYFKGLGAVGHDPLHNETVLKNYGKCLRKCKKKPHVGPCIDACLGEQPAPGHEALGNTRDVSSHSAIDAYRRCTDPGGAEVGSKITDCVDAQLDPIEGLGSLGATKRPPLTAFPTPEQQPSAEDVLAAVYADGWMDDFSKAARIRRLQWLGDSMTVAQWTAAMRRATPNGYNAFKAVRVGKVLAAYSGITVTPAREYSVAAYVHGPLSVLQQIAEQQSKMSADEATVYPTGTSVHVQTASDRSADMGRNVSGPVLRLWWD